nr:hypothetical protein [Tanacetum cinerariifolium]
IQGRYDQDMVFNLDFDAAKEVSNAEKEVSTIEQVSTASAIVTTASIDVSPSTVRLQEELDEEERQRMARVYEAA